MEFVEDLKNWSNCIWEGFILMPFQFYWGSQRKNLASESSFWLVKSNLSLPIALVIWKVSREPCNLYIN